MDILKRKEGEEEDDHDNRRLPKKKRRMETVLKNKREANDLVSGQGTPSSRMGLLREETMERGHAGRDKGLVKRSPEGRGAIVKLLRDKIDWQIKKQDAKEKMFR